MNTRRWIVGVVVPCLTAVVGGFVGARLAAADPGGHTRRALTVAGTLTGAGSSAMVTFRFRKGTVVQCAPVVMVMPGAGGVFSAEVPMDQAGQVCPDALFDGSDMQVDVLVGGTAVVNGSAVNPVPYARYAEQVGTPDCPVSYERDRTESRWVVCTRSVTLGAAALRDEVVKVGTGASAFWMDRYEASVWDATSGVQYGAESDNYPSRLNDNGQWAAGSRDSLLSLSRTGVTPSRFLSWFQAAAVCGASGKRLMTRREWYSAADGLVAVDPPTPLNGNATGEHGCNTGGTVGPRATGLGTDCTSSWGVQDLIGNLWETTDDWYAAAGTSNGTNNAINIDARNWPTGYGDDGTQNINGSVVAEVPTRVVGLPAVGLRGGQWSSGPTAGVFALDLGAAPSYVSASIGFRCVIPR